MKKAMILILNMLVLSTTVPAYSEEMKKLAWVPDITGEVAFETKYVWRGQTLVDDAVIQPGGSVRLEGFTFSVWGNYDTGSGDRFTEWDYIFDYTFNIEKVNASLGYTYYTFPNLSGDAWDTHEPYIGFSYDVFLEPFLTYYIDVDTGAGSYWEFGVSHAFELPGDIEAGLGITGGYNAGQWNYGWSFSNLLFAGEVSIPILKYFAVSPNVNYSLALDEAYDSEFYAGVKAGVSY